MIGSNVYFIDAKERCVMQGFILQIILSQSGYVIYNILSEGKMHNIERSLIFTNKEQADEYLPKFLKVKDEMDALNKQTNAKLDEMRESVIGKPEFKELVEDVFKK